MQSIDRAVTNQISPKNNYISGSMVHKTFKFSHVRLKSSETDETNKQKELEATLVRCALTVLVVNLLKINEIIQV